MLRFPLILQLRILGYVWAASWNQSGVGTLQVLTVDASAFDGGSIRGSQIVDGSGSNTRPAEKTEEQKAEESRLVAEKAAADKAAADKKAADLVAAEKAAAEKAAAEQAAAAQAAADCPSSDNLRLIRLFAKRGSGSSGLEFKQPAVDAASGGLRWCRV
ncbi:hypothetical protein M2212_008779 [Bradyrhizobium elkanii]|uniref:hypothetical protein n=1 Tax=Bradyrhizobium elkanii TaxID=29448 RepID=UPI002168E90C|nr:hypothetical protein [Bradyrhizobium elkanii]MCS3481933.1 hypothetical protein [Bradyrhizobium elkanii]